MSTETIFGFPLFISTPGSVRPAVGPGTPQFGKYFFSIFANTILVNTILVNNFYYSINISFSLPHLADSSVYPTVEVGALENILSKSYPIFP